jgi:hypothetical protein
MELFFKKKYRLLWLLSFWPKFWSNIEDNNFGTKWFQLESIKLYLILQITPIAWCTKRNNSNKNNLLQSWRQWWWLQPPIGMSHHLPAGVYFISLFTDYQLKVRQKNNVRIKHNEFKIRSYFRFLIHFVTKLSNVMLFLFFPPGSLVFFRFSNLVCCALFLVFFLDLPWLTVLINSIQM